jgi:hypothetical protein
MGWRSQENYELTNERDFNACRGVIERSFNGRDGLPR